ncbi:MAG: pyridoxamine 5'-phosphate oxidase [Syntrophus sp. (in: bacteria)]|nr:pyridoxamine 5'-phosphate oxidase [Syntrophus sp. (in: bacteria)]
MNRAEIIAFLNEHPLSFLATLEGDQPRVRGMALHKADENGLIYQTGDGKDLWHQVLKNPKMEICFNDLQAGIQIRVTGIAEVVEDQGLKEEIVKTRPFLKPVVEKLGYKVIKVFRVSKCKVYVWTMENNFAPKEWVDL